jgi:mannose-6-phosphate isomerase-like protein (cupin superfamily)
MRRTDIPRFANSDVVSEQLLFPENSKSERITITRVTVAPGARNPPHVHTNSEQVWIALGGRASLLLADAATASFAESDVVRFAEGDVHGLENFGTEDFVYLSVTSPPLNFRAAYSAHWQPGADNM